MDGFSLKMTIIPRIIGLVIEKLQRTKNLFFIGVTY